MNLHYNTIPPAYPSVEAQKDNKPPAEGPVKLTYRAEKDAVHLLVRESSGTLSVSFNLKRGEAVGKFDGGGADSFSVVEQRDIVDSLWMDRTERRKIRLGKWLHGWEVQTSEDVLADPSSMPYTDKVEKALSTFKDVLWTLLTTPERVSSLKVPAKGWLESQKKNLTKTMIPYVGSLSIVERAQISNWFEAHISKDPKLRKHWLGLLPIAHAHTLFIASCLKVEPRNRDLAESDTLKKAWSLQLTGVPSVWTDVDVDRECLDLLEEQMFEISSQAGIAGHYQWGLDAGAHQAGWNPYAGAPPHWNHGDRDGSDTELEAPDSSCG
ncbi:hypothetical protein D9615_009459 [Tricholomella constricta]|uniref:Uncharacterized protein n=1 Tax=Tricholomella constricta TaxID=117010 RepID=A0A8H5GZ54_9AGAR|nr:hypothetical protein D9615_009459 [Tricholomella constricta]